MDMDLFDVPTLEEGDSDTEFFLKVVTIAGVAVAGISSLLLKLLSESKN